jgi:uncharacterized protein (DUF1501 family)
MKAGGLALVSLGADPIFLDRAAYALQRTGGTGTSGKTLVCLFQRGAVDGLSMIVPAGDSFYWQERQRIALPREQLIPLDGTFALHPRLAPLKPLWDQHALAIVHAVGSPSTSRSHFDAQDYMESGTPDVKNTPDGWANRYCSHAAEHVNTPFRAVAFGPELPRTLSGSAPALAIEDLRTFGMRAAQANGEARLTRAFEELYQGEATGLVASSSAESFEAIKMLKAANPAAVAPSNGASYDRNQLAVALQQIAQLIKADLGVEIAFVDVGGWDTHVNQGADQGQLASRLDELGKALAAFTTDLGPRMQDVAVITMSEFGRTVKENGTGGTDHGHGTAMMILGGGVRGGQVLGKWPGLAPEQRFEGRDLAVTTDFRSVFGELLTGHLGPTDMSQVFPGFTPAGKVGLFG